MFSAFRSSLRRTCRPQRTSSHAQRACLSTRAHLPRRSVWVPVAVGTVTLSAALLLNTVIRSDSNEGTKQKSKSKAKQREQESDPEASPSKPEELLRAKEEEAKSEGSRNSQTAESDTNGGEAEAGAGAGAGAEEEQSGGGAFNPETGEINWDCPCLGGMAHGPCGQEFRDAFSCFVFSEEEPKGINCVEKFKAMQDCFRRHPEVYGEEIMSDDDDDDSSEPTGTDSPGLEGEVMPEPEPLAAPPPGIVSPSS